MAKTKLIAEMVESNVKYLKGDLPTMSDAEYDQHLVEDLKPEEAEMVEELAIKEYLQTTTDKGKHPSKMYSLHKVYGEEAFIEELNKIAKKLNLDPKCLNLICQPKIDGMAINIIYKKGKLVSILSRGDGLEGMELISKADYFKHESLIRELPTDIDLEIRAEAYIKTDVFHYSKTFINSGYVGQRQAVAAILREKDYKSEYSNQIDVFHYGVGKDHPFKNYIEFLTYLRKCGSKDGDLSLFHPLRYLTPRFFVDLLEQNLTEYIDPNLIALLTDIRYNLPTDGLVFRLTDFKQLEELGYTRRYPKGMFALKASLVSDTTTVEGINLTLSKNGVLTPEILIKPITLNRIECKRLNAFTANYLETYKVRVGDKVVLDLRGGVIPAIRYFINQPDNNQPLLCELDYNCPCCGSKVIRKGKDFVCSEAKMGGKCETWLAKLLVELTAISSKKVSSEKVFNEVVKKYPNLYGLIDINLDELLSLAVIPTKEKKENTQSLTEFHKMLVEMKHSNWLKRVIYFNRGLTVCGNMIDAVRLQFAKSGYFDTYKDLLFSTKENLKHPNFFLSQEITKQFPTAKSFMDHYASKDIKLSGMVDGETPKDFIEKMIYLNLSDYLEDYINLCEG